MWIGIVGHGKDCGSAAIRSIKSVLSTGTGDVDADTVTIACSGLTSTSVETFRL